MGNKQKHRRHHCDGYITHNDDKIRLKCIKLGFYGDYGVGKTSIVNSIIGVQFNQDTLSNIGYDISETNYEIKKDISKKLKLWDTSSQGRSLRITLSTLKSVQGIVIIFDLTDRTSFENLNNWINEVYENVGHKRPIVLLGNKADREKEKREVNDEEIKDYAESKKLKYFEVSAKTKKGIDDALKYIVNEIINKYDII